MRSVVTMVVVGFFVVGVLLEAALVVVLCLLNDFASVDDGPDPSNEEDGEEELGETDEDTSASVLSVTGIDDCAEAWPDNVQDEADVSHTDISDGNYVIRAAHTYSL